MISLPRLSALSACLGLLAVTVGCSSSTVTTAGGSSRGVGGLGALVIEPEFDADSEPHSAGKKVMVSSGCFRCHSVNGARSTPGELAGGGGRGGGPAGARAARPQMTPAGFLARPLFEGLDANKDGKVTKDEFIAAVKQFAQRVDKAKTGRLGENSIKAGLARTLPPAVGAPTSGEPIESPLSATAAAAIVKRSSPDADSNITIDNLVSAAEALFAELDKDGKGSLDEAGVEAGINLLTRPQGGGRGGPGGGRGGGRGAPPGTRGGPEARGPGGAGDGPDARGPAGGPGPEARGPGGGELPGGMVLGPAGVRAPDLGKVGSDPTHTVEWIIALIKNPKSKREDARMPPFEGKIKDDDIRAVAEYLATLK